MAKPTREALQKEIDDAIASERRWRNYFDSRESAESHDTWKVLDAYRTLMTALWNYENKELSS